MLILNVIYELLKFMKVLTQKNIMIMFLVVLLIKLFVLTIICRGENAAYEFIKAILEEYKYCKKIMKKHLFNHERRRRIFILTK